MKSWLSYIGAFALALAAAVLVYRAAFTVLMTGASWGMAGFVVLAVLAPMVVALVVFVVGYGVFSSRWMRVEHWVMAGGFASTVVFACFFLIVQDVMEEVPAALLMTVILFVGGRFLLKRASLV